MDFISAIKSGFSKYATFSGRARRSEYWFWQLFTFLVGIGLSIISAIDGVDANGDPRSGFFTAVAGLASLALFLPSLAMLVRRLHDIGKSGWHVVYWGVLPGLVAFPMMLVGFGMAFAAGFGAMGGDDSALAAAAGALALMGLGFLIIVAFSAVLFVFTLLDSKPANKYGPSPKATQAPAEAAEGTTA